MPGTSPTTAQSEHYHLILTLYQSEDHRLLEEPFLTASTGVLTRTGQEFQLEGHIYRAVLSQGLKASTMWSTVGQNVGVVMRWGSDTLAPVDIDLSYAVGELARIDEASGGTAVAAWGSRLVLLTGRVASYSWGDAFESLEFTLAGTQPIDRGDWYAVGAELTSARFANIDNTGERDRAPKCKGALPPRCWAPVGSSVAVPAMVVVDEVDAVPGVTALQYRRHLIGYDPPAQTASAEQIRILNGGAGPQWLGAADSSAYRVIPAQGTDLLGDVYWYIPGSYVQTFGPAASITFTNGSSSATIRGISTTVQDGWQVKGTTGGLDDYLVRIEHAGLDSTLGDSTGATVAYTGPTLTGQGNSIPLPIDQLDSVYWLPTLYGGHRGISQVTDVLIDWISQVDLGYPVMTGDLDGMRSRLALFDLTYVRRTRGSPWAKLLEVLEYLPIRTYLYDGAIRFKWRGPITEQDIVATIYLDTDCGAYRSRAIEWGDDETFPIIEISHSWNLPNQVFNGKLTIDQDSGARAYDAWNNWRDGLTRPRLQREFDTLETSPGVELAAQWMLYRSGVRAQMMTVDIDATWRWLEPGMAIRVTQTGAIKSDAWWWIEGVTFGADGKGELLLEMGA